MSFIAEPPLRTARRLADRELRDRAAAADVRWLHRHPVWWLRALVDAERDINDRVSRARAELPPIPASGENQQAYIVAKVAFDEWAKTSLRAKRRIERRKADVISLFGVDHATSPGDLVRVFHEITAALDDDDITAARDLALFWADRLGKETT
jgi:hypothetical protein